MRPLPSMARPATSSSSGAAASTPGRERSSLTGARGGAASSGPLGAGVVPGGGAPPAGWSVAGARPEMLPRLIASGHPVGGDRFRWSEPPVCTNTKVGCRWGESCVGCGHNTQGAGPPGLCASTAVGLGMTCRYVLLYCSCAIVAAALFVNGTAYYIPRHILIYITGAGPG